MTTLLSLPSAALPPDAVEVARIGEAWGVKGWFKVQAHSAQPQALLSARCWYLQPPDKGARTFSGTVQLQVQQVRAHGDGLVACAPAVADRTAAEQLRGARVFLARADFPPAEEGEYYWVDLIGLDVFNREGQPLGQVRDLLATGPQTTLVLACDEGGKSRERLIPFVDAFVDSVDLPARRITVDWQPDY